MLRVTVLGICRCAIAFLFLPLLLARAADTEKVLYSFNGVNVASPIGLSADASGNLYGAGSGTPAHQYGSVFKLSKGPSGHWNMTVLYEFRSKADGYAPNGAFVFDSSGNLYGTAAFGGPGAGIVFELSPTAGGPWKKTTIYSFTGLSDGSYPYAGLIFDAAGNLYGTASSGGHGYGTVYELSPSSGGQWIETTLHEFVSGDDGNLPAAPLVFDSKGNLYGTTWDGGGKNTSVCVDSGCGTVFELTSSSGSWVEQVIYAFDNGDDGDFPDGPLVVDNAGNLYGTAGAGGGFGYGEVFELSPGSGGVWTESTLYSFAGSSDGQLPEGGLIRTTRGDLYGLTDAGGAACNCGTVFEVSPTAGGGWSKATLYTFSGGTDGSDPYIGLVIDKLGNLYGTTYYGGAYNEGTVFKLFP